MVAKSTQPWLSLLKRMLLLLKQTFQPDGNDGSGGGCQFSPNASRGQTPAFNPIMMHVYQASGVVVPGGLDHDVTVPELKERTPF